MLASASRRTVRCYDVLAGVPATAVKHCPVSTLAPNLMLHTRLLEEALWNHPNSIKAFPLSDPH